ncbi:hypothetical protein PG993_012715 [Apiospora rasikravindrae]|uniref:Zn(2)-C6 fungal-type domain-containing protein n=1 Tax=Apiospora rasikravindrae TaxID=990691 RepID=A0ABR1S5G9_9PEZI
MDRVDISLARTKPKPSRTSTPKVRTGCVTCKKRHIRCDEARPDCHNCQKSHRACGYANAGQTATTTTLVPKHPPLRVASSPLKQALLNADCQDFSDATGARYFDEFANLVRGYWITGTSNQDFWGVTAPQFARASPLCRHAAMAIGALSIWFGESDSRSLRARPDEESTHYVQALAHHGRSLRMHQQRNSLHDTSFLAVLLLFFDILRGNSQAAMAHVNHGLALVLALMTDNDSGDETNRCLAPNPTRFFVEMADVFADIAIQSRTVLHGRVGHCSPLPNFARGLRSKQQTLDSFMVLLSRQFLSSPNASNRVPAVFSNLDEFENCLNTAVGRHSTIGPVMMEIVRDSGILESNDPHIIDKYYPEILGNAKIRDYCETIRRDMQELGDAFLPLFNRILVADFDKAVYLRAINLRLQYLGILLFSDPTRHLHVESIQELTPSFREYLSLVEIAIRKMKDNGTGNPAHQMSMQCKLSYYVMIVAFFCREPTVRDQAIAILADYPGQDGIWNTQALYATALKSRVVERDNAVDGTPDEQWRRLIRREFVYEDGGSRILFRFLARDEASGEWKLVEQVADVSGGLEGLRWVPQPLTGSGKLLIGDLLPS